MRARRAARRWLGRIATPLVVGAAVLWFVIDALALSLLHPLLRRLEGQNLLVSEWRIEDGPPRRYYKLSPAGRALYGRLVGNWNALVDTVGGLIADDDAGSKRKKDGR